MTTHYGHILDDVGEVDETVGYGHILGETSLEDALPDIADVIPESQLVEGELGGFVNRMRLGDAKNAQEKVEVFKSIYPKGDIMARRTDFGGPAVLMFRETPDSPWKRIDEGIKKGGMLGFVRDIADFVGEDGGAVLGETALAFNSKGISLLKLMGRLFAGGFLGESAQEGFQALRGEQREDVQDIALRAGKKSAVAAPVGGVSEIAIRGATNIAQRRVAITTSRGAEKAVAATRRVTGKELPAAAVSDNPLIERVFNVARATTPQIGRYFRNLSDSTTRVLSTLRKSGVAAEKLPAALDKTERRLRREMAKAAVERFKKTSTNINALSNNYKQLIKAYDDVGKTKYNVLFQKARDIEPPQFDVSQVTTQAELIVNDLISFPDGDEVIKHLPGVKKIAAEILDGNGQIGPQIIMFGDQAREVMPERVIKSWITDLGAMAAPEPGRGMTRQQVAAAQLRNDLLRVIDNPTNANPEFRAAYQMAKDAFRTHRQVMQNGYIVEAMATETPHTFVSNLVRSGNVDELRIVKQVMGKDFVKVRDAFLSDIFQNGAAERTLDKLPKEWLRQMFTGDEITQLRAYGRALTDFQELGMQNIARRQATNRGAIQEMLNKGSRSIEVFVNSVNVAGGRNSEVGQAARNALLDYVYSKSVIEKKGQLLIDGSALKKELTSLIDKGFGSLLTVGDKKLMLDLSRAAGFVQKGLEAGVSIAATETATGVRALEKSALIHLLESVTVAKLATTDLGNQLLLGSGRRKLERSGLLAAMAAAFQQAADEDPNVTLRLGRALDEATAEFNEEAQ